MRERVRAIIIHDGKICLIGRVKIGLPKYWAFPGGGVEENESHNIALKRECMEELGFDIYVERAIAEDEYINKDGDQHETFYICSIIKTISEPFTGPEGNRDLIKYGAYSLEWIEIDKMHEMNIVPNKVRDLIPGLVD